MANRKQRRQQRRLVGKLPGETLAEAKTRKQQEAKIFRETLRDQTLENKAEIRTQRAIWLCCLAMKRAFDTTPEQYLEFTEALRVEVSQYEKRKRPGYGDEVYANEMLRREASACIGGEISPLYDEEMLEAVEKAGCTRTNGDQIRAMTDEELAVGIFHAWQASIEAEASFNDLSLEWCHGEETCEGIICTDEKVVGCILNWVRSPVKQEADHGA